MSFNETGYGQEYNIAVSVYRSNLVPPNGKKLHILRIPRQNCVATSHSGPER
jgi:hypothetical protein